jgi:LDH2 family malate/lactate/ureidoglycolate dehydrogenase
MQTAIARTPFTPEALRRFVSDAMLAVRANAEDAELTADVLVASDLRGIESHGVARLERFYIDRILEGFIDPQAAEETVRETPATLAVDARNGMGHPVSVRTMRRTIEKARETGCAVATVRNSNHYGIAGYYAALALPHDAIGISSTNSGRLAVPTFGRDLMLGTNPFAFAIPGRGEDAFVLDMATTAVARGKLEIAKRLGKQLKTGWAVDRDGRETLDPDTGIAGALLPLGGPGTEHGGHKGFGLGLLADILCGVLGGGIFTPDMPMSYEDPQKATVSHFFAAVRIDGFRDPAAFRADVQRELEEFRASEPAPGFDRVFTPGEPEAIREREHRRAGIGLDPIVVESLDRVAARLNIAPARRLA